MVVSFSSGKKMNTRARSAPEAMKAPLNHEKVIFFYYSFSLSFSTEAIFIVTVLILLCYIQELKGWNYNSMKNPIWVFKLASSREMGLTWKMLVQFPLSETENVICAL
uniref:Uncharacterized protein n=1 Tax=Rhizophora mucronata TaxID=61149 RepID=A0A2P2QZI7_RHIMU